jgi:hypothetical protein
MSNPDETFEAAFEQVVQLGNRLADDDGEADVWDIADGVLAGAIQYWLYSRQPCGDPRCEDCLPINSAEARLAELKRLLTEYAQESDYYHSPADVNVGRA